MVVASHVGTRWNMVTLHVFSVCILLAVLSSSSSSTHRPVYERVGKVGDVPFVLRTCRRMLEHLPSCAGRAVPSTAQPTRTRKSFARDACSTMAPIESFSLLPCARPNCLGGSKAQCSSNSDVNPHTNLRTCGQMNEYLSADMSNIRNKCYLSQ